MSSQQQNSSMFGRNEMAALLGGADQLVGVDLGEQPISNNKKKQNDDLSHLSAAQAAALLKEQDAQKQSQQKQQQQRHRAPRAMGLTTYSIPMSKEMPL